MSIAMKMKNIIQCESRENDFEYIRHHNNQLQIKSFAYLKPEFFTICIYVEHTQLHLNCSSVSIYANTAFISNKWNFNFRVLHSNLPTMTTTKTKKTTYKSYIVSEWRCSLNWLFRFMRGVNSRIYRKQIII